jgi:DNA polymerase III alpha subunit
MHPTRHPMAVLRGEAARVGCLPSDALASRIGGTARFAGVVAAGRRLVTRTGGVMHFVTFEDERGLIEAAVFPGIFAALRDPVRNPGPYLVRGRVAGEPRDPLLEVSDVLPFHLRDTVKP